jgi:hypothetical protein
VAKRAATQATAMAKAPGTLRDKLPWVLGIALPAAVVLLYVIRFAVNVPIYDEWNFMPVVGEFYAGGDWWPLVAEHYGEHRIVLPKLIILFLSRLTALDLRVEQFLSALLMIATTVVAWWLLRRTEGCPRWAIVPVGWLLLSTGQFENLLIGWQFQIPLMNFGAILAVWLLHRQRPVAAAAAAFAATFSFANGMMIWPACLPLVWVQGRRRRGLAIWLGAGLVAAVAYRWGYSGFSRPPQGYLFAFARQPANAIKMALALYGNNFGGGQLWGNVAAGVCLAALSGLAIWLLRRTDRWRRSDLPWVALWLFSAFSIGAVVLGRSFVWQHMSTPSRFLTVAIFVPVALTVLLCRVGAALWERYPHAVHGVRLAAGLLIAAALYQEWRTVAVGWDIGKAHRQEKQVAGQCLLEYRQAPVECLRKLFVADGEFVRRGAAILERYSLGPFAGRPRPAANPRGMSAFEGSVEKVSVASPKAVVEGWALTGELGAPAVVILSVDGNWVAATSHFSKRRDVEAYFGRPLPASAWRIEFSTVGLAPGDHEIGALALGPGDAKAGPVPGRQILHLEAAAAPALP